MENPVHHDDSRTQEFSDLWFDQRLTLTVERKDALALAYVEYALKLGKAVARGFSKEIIGATSAVCKRMETAENQDDLLKFWIQVRRILRRPHTYATEDVHFLANGGRDSAFEMFSQLNLENGSHLVERLLKIALVSK